MSTGLAVASLSKAEILGAAVDRVRSRFATDPARRRVLDAALESIAGDLSIGIDPSIAQAGVSSGSTAVEMVVAFLEEELIWGADDQTAAPTLELLQSIMRSRAPAPHDGFDAAGSTELRERLRSHDGFELLVEVAHDFRSPLTSILFLAEAIREGLSGPVSTIQREQLGLIYGAAFELSAIAADVIEHARQERGLVEGDPQAFAVAGVFESVDRLVRPIVQAKGLEMRIVAPDLLMARGHPHAVTRVILNLTTNALKFTERGYVEMGVETGERCGVRFYVKDTGRGIQPERIADLYAPFKRRHRAGDPGQFFSGSGLGLSIARRLVSGMGSQLRLETSPQTGTRFYFDVPLA